jgi:hypothetical protein
LYYVQYVDMLGIQTLGLATKNLKHVSLTPSFVKMS